MRERKGGRERERSDGRRERLRRMEGGRDRGRERQMEGD